jgi:hypothetical protein
MGNLQFNSQNVTRLLRIANSTSNWASNTNTPVQIVQAGYLRELIMIAQGTPAFTGSPVIDPWGPWSIFSNIQVNSNVQAGVYNVSGLGANWIAQVLWGLEQMGNTPDSALISPSGVNAWNNMFEYNAPVVAPTNMQNTLFQVPFWIPLAQKINTLDGYVGIWDLQDPSIQMTLNYTPSSTSSSSPFTLSNNNANPNGSTPVYGVTASNNLTIATPSNLITRVMYDPPLDPQNDPEFGYVHSWYEEMWNTALPGSSTINWRALANSGYITRLIFSVADAANFASAAANTGIGVADSNMKLSNAINLTVGNNAPVIVETAYESAFRQFQELGHRLPQGVFFIDFLGRDLTLQNVLDTFTAGNINLQMNFNSALGSTAVGGVNSNGKVIRGMLQALMQ